MSRVLDHPTPPRLPTLFLDNIAILPALQLSVPIPEDIARAIAKHVQASEYPMLGVFPLPGPGKPPLRSGCAARVLRVSRSAGSTSSSRTSFTLIVQGLTRIHLTEPLPLTLPAPHLLTEYEVTYPSLASADHIPSKDIVHAFRTAAFRLLDRLDLESSNPAVTTARLRPDLWRRLRSLVQDVNPAGAVWLADIVMGVVEIDWEDKLAFLAVTGVEDRLRKATEIFNKRSDISEVSTKISQEVGETLSNQQKEFFLRQQLQAIQKELSRLSRSKNGSNSSPAGEGSKSSDLDDEKEDEEEAADIRRKIEAMTPQSEERKMAVREWKRLKRIPAGSVENGVIRSYLEWLTSVPWPGTSNASEESTTALLDKAFLSKARAQLDADHYGLDQIKRRLIEYLAVMRLRSIQVAQEPTSTKDAAPRAPALKGPILLLVGPPGCGKTSIAQSIAKALHRPFQRISLGGVRDEAEIRGHRRTYVASGPGAIVQALRRAGRPDMLLLLDEIDKVGHNNFHGDPSAALLEVLDPEQNHAFVDHYLNVPVDLSQVMMVATANSLETISPPLLDRCEVITLSGYTYDEKMHIAKSFLLPKQLKANGLPASELEVTDTALQYIASRYTREAGVRTLERQIGAVVRYKAVQWADAQELTHTNNPITDQSSYDRVVDEKMVSEILGLEWWNPEERDTIGKRGVVNGLVVQGAGEGGLLSIETLLVPGSGRFRATGSLGDVIKESGDLALSWVKANAYKLGITSTPTDDPLLVPDSVDIHLHLPSGAQKKDGPSAGLAMVCAFVSLLTGAVVPSNIAMTGEITLRGHVTPIGGVKEKVLGAHRASISKVILPRKNAREFHFEFDKHPLRNEVEVVFVSTIREGLEAAFGPGVLRWRDEHPFVPESRL
ncbi:ATP-dependent protease La [Clavulina sp. PMI_390]|nr:ATP-dependent protease La [Clavulina sp. PMI_390]